MTGELTIEAMRQQDHDSITRLEVGMTQIAKDIKDIKDGTATQLADHESRLKTIEALMFTVQPEKTLAEFRTLQQQVHDFTVTASAYRVITGFIGGALVFFLISLPNVLRSLGVIH